MNHWENMYTLLGIGLVMIGLGAALVRYEAEATALVNAYYPGLLSEDTPAPPADALTKEMPAEEVPVPEPPEDPPPVVEAPTETSPAEPEPEPEALVAEAEVEPLATPEPLEAPTPVETPEAAPVEEAVVESAPEPEPAGPAPDDLVFPFFPARAFSDYEAPSTEPAADAVEIKPARQPPS